MSISSIISKPGVYPVIITLLFASIQAPAQAGMVGTAELSHQTEIQMQRDNVREFVSRDDVRSAMLGYGVDPGIVDARINSLTSSELLQLQNQIADLPAGGNGVLGVVVGIILIFVLLDLLGATDVFPRI